METFHHILKLSFEYRAFSFMYLLEESLKNLSGRGFNSFTTHYKKCHWCLRVGAIVTGILQSSSMFHLWCWLWALVYLQRDAMAIILEQIYDMTVGW
jgi:phosphate:Na+ symporter